MTSDAPTVANRPSIFPAVIGIGLTGALVLALGFWVAGRSGSTPTSPTVTILSPAADTSVAGVIHLQFTTSLPLELLPTGWGSGRYHLHLLLNGVEHMPAAADIQRLSNGYSWRLKDLPDSTEVQLVWALPSHQRLPVGASERRQIRSVRP